MSNNDLQNIGLLYAKMLDGVPVVTEKVKQDIGKADLQKGGPDEKGGFSKSKVDPKCDKGGKMKADDYFGKKKQSVETCDEDEEDEKKDKKSKKGFKPFEKKDKKKEAPKDKKVAKVTKLALESVDNGANIRMLAEHMVTVGRRNLSELYTLIEGVNATDINATTQLLSALNKGKSNPLYAECLTILKKLPKLKEQRTINESRKRESLTINTLSMKKSSFQKLYESAMGDDFDELGELGVDQGGEENSEFGDLGGELSDDVEAEEVTISLSKDLARQLYDLLGAVVNVEDELGDEFDDEAGLDDNPDGAGDPFGDETGGAFGDEDEETIGHALKGAKAPDNGKSNKVGNLKVSSGSANNGTAAPKVGADGDWGHALKGAKQPDMGKNNKVGNLKTNKSLFEQ